LFIASAFLSGLFLQVAASLQRLRAPSTEAAEVVCQGHVLECLRSQPDDDLAGRVRLLARVKPDEEGRFSPFARDRLAELRRSLR